MNYSESFSQSSIWQIHVQILWVPCDSFYLKLKYYIIYKTTILVIFNIFSLFHRLACPMPWEIHSVCWAGHPRLKESLRACVWLDRAKTSYPNHETYRHWVSSQSFNWFGGSFFFLPSNKASKKRRNVCGLGPLL